MTDPGLREIWHGLSQEVENIVAWKTRHAWLWSLPGGIVGAAATWLSTKVAPRTMLQIVFSDAGSARVIVPQILGTNYSSEYTSGRKRLPTNTPVLPLGDAMAIQMIADAVRSSFKLRKRTDFRTAPWADESFISVGGRSINPHASRAQEEIIDLLQFEKETHSFRVGDSVLAAKINAKTLAVEHDYGFIVIRTNPETQTRSVFLWGIWPTGTHAAAKEFLHSDQFSVWRRYSDWLRPGSSQTAILRRRLRTLLMQGKYAVGIVHAVPTDAVNCEAKLIAVHEVSRA